MATTTGRPLFLALLLLFFVGLSVQYSFKATQNRSAILRWQPQIAELDDGANIAARHNYPNPPMMAVLLMPLMKLPPLAAALGWFYAKVAMALASLGMAFRIVSRGGVPFPPWAMALAVLLSLRPIVGDLQHGNVNIFILFLVVASLAAYTRGWDATAGLVLALAIACKVTPALFVPYFLYKRAWKTLAGCAAGLVLFLLPGLVPALVLGWDDNAAHLGSWYRGMVRPSLVEGKVWSEHNNQSLVGLTFRLLTESPSFSRYDGPVYVPTAYDNWLSLTPGQAKGVVQACLLAYLGLAVWACRTPARPRGGWRLGAEFALVTLGMLLFSERTWKHHCVMLVVPFAVLCYVLSTQLRPGWPRYGLGAALAAAVVLMSLTSTGLLPDAFAKQAQVYGAYTAAFLVLLAAVAVCLLCRRSGFRPDSSSVSGSKA